MDEAEFGEGQPPRRNRFSHPGRRELALGICLIAVSFCAACIPLKFTTSPGASGRVVDASTHSPLSGAQLAISRSTYPPDSADQAFTNSRSPIVLSQDGGGFSIPPERRLDIYCIPIDPFPRFGLLVVKCPGYETTCVPFWSRFATDLGDIQVQPAAPAK